MNFLIFHVMSEINNKVKKRSQATRVVVLASKVLKSRKHV